MGPILRRTLYAALALAGVALVVWLLRPAPVGVDTAAVVRKPLIATVSDEGVTRIREVYHVSSPLTGEVERSPREAGDYVTAGETVLAVLHPVDPTFVDERSRRELEATAAAAEAAVALADARVIEAEARHTFALSDVARAKRLRASNTISARVLEERELAASAALAALGSARAEAAMRRRESESAQARLLQPSAVRIEPGTPECCITVHAPTDGVVIEVAIESEQVVVAGTELMRIGDPSDIEIMVDLLSREAVKVPDGARGWIDGWGGPRLDATVRRVDPAARTEISALGLEEQRVEVILDLDGPIEPDNRLGHNYRVIAHIVVDEVADALTVPLSALFRTDGAWTVFVVEDGTARLRGVEIGLRSTTDAEVRTGLTEGETVVIHPSDAVENGTRIEQRPQ